MDSNEERVQGQRGRWLELTYEELVADPTAATRRVYNILGVSPSKPAPSVARNIPRQSSGKMCDAIVNFEELKSAFAGTERAIDFE